MRGRPWGGGPRAKLAVPNDGTAGPGTGGIGVVEHQFVDAHRGVVRRDCLEDLGNTETTSTEDGELHTVMTSVPAD